MTTDTAALRALLAEATPAPWGWLWSNGLALSSQKHGRLYICDATRMGMNGATMRFVERDTPTAGGIFKTFTPPKERRGVSDWLTDAELTKDMALIVALRNAAPGMLDEIDLLSRKAKAFDAIALRDVEALRTTIGHNGESPIYRWEVYDRTGKNHPSTAHCRADLLTAIEQALATDAIAKESP